MIKVATPLYLGGSGIHKSDQDGYANALVSLCVGGGGGGGGRDVYIPRWSTEVFGLCWGKGIHTTDQSGRRKCLVSVGGKVYTQLIKVVDGSVWSLLGERYTHN